MNNETTERAAFEAAMRKLSNGEPDWKSPAALWAWSAWQARASAATQAEPEFTDSARGALLWVLWHHQGGSSPVGQPIRFALGMGQHDRLSGAQVAEAKRWDALMSQTARAKADDAAPVVPPVALPALTDEQIDALLLEFSWGGDRDVMIGHCAIVTAQREKVRSILAASAAPAPEQMQPNADYEEVLADHRRLVRELDVLLNGEEGAAQQASLCDIVAHLKRDKGHLAAPLAGAPCGDEAVEPELIEIVRKALHRAYSLGQTYWAQADSESYAANKRSEETAAKMEQLSTDTLAALSAVPPTVKE